ncbi:hypothetical protein K1719_036140 [Acacia pycnantha]|nr:hypothetical protein K1719_036139 [Acacia pycnantha]KAI9081878.1 hypothetical protein K1719_036140 [Acacia pycnantha]
MKSNGSKCWELFWLIPLPILKRLIIKVCALYTLLVIGTTTSIRVNPSLSSLLYPSFESSLFLQPHSKLVTVFPCISLFLTWEVVWAPKLKLRASETQRRIPNTCAQMEVIVLGEGGFGSVFKGWIDEQFLTAANPGTFHHRRAEVNFLQQFCHPHLVKLIGYCLEDEHRLLVYEFMPRGSLESHLFRRGSYFQPLSWSHRLKVTLGAARGLAFLHSAETRVIYRDLKTSNILLDSVCVIEAI